MGGLRGGGQPLPTQRSRAVGLAFQVGVAAVAGALVLPSGGTWAALGSGVTTLVFALVVWWQMGRWFTLVVAAEGVGFLLLRAVTGLGMGQTAAAIAVPAVLGTPLWFVASTATWMQALRSVVVTPVDPREVEVGQQVVDELQAAGFRTEADLAYGLYGRATVVAAFPHRSQPVYAEVTMGAGGGAHAGGVVTLLQGGGALETETGASFPRGATRLRQVFPRADLATLTRRHLEAVSWLTARGVAAVPATAGSYAMSVEAMLDDTAAALRAHPVWHAGRHVVLRILRRQLDQRPLPRQRDVGNRVKAVLAGV